jgi:chromosome segregation ATPase
LNAVKAEVITETTRRREAEAESLHWQTEYTKLMETHRQLMALQSTVGGNASGSAPLSPPPTEEERIQANAQIAVLQRTIEQLKLERTELSDAVQDLMTRKVNLASEVKTLTEKRDMLLQEIEGLKNASRTDEANKT